MIKRRAGLAVGALAMVVAIVATTIPATAFKPYTHNNTGFDARADAIDNGNVTINGREYPVAAEVVTALRNWPSFYNAGVIGPDGFPDLTMGQSIIHPVNTGRWLRYILDRAWAAQTDGSYSDPEQEQILAFAYGFLTHAAGDLWAHTMVNELSGEVFPGVGEILTDIDAAAIAIRHLIIEGYVGDATRFFDGNPNRTTLPDGDVSDDSTPGIQFDAPIRFIYETLVRRDAPGAPSTDRGPLLGFFYGLRDSLDAFAENDPQPIQDAIDSFNDTKERIEDAQDDCNFDGVLDTAHDLVACPIALLGIAGAALVDSAEAFANLVAGTIAAGIKAIMDAYVNAWIDDIDDGLRHWGELGLASTRALFDPQARRNTQNHDCGPKGSETDQVRINCEDGIGILDTLFHEADPFINDHLLSMLGAPDIVGDLRSLLQDLADELSAILGPILNPLTEALAEIKEFIKELLKDAINDRFGIDIDLIQDFLASPSSKMDVTEIPLGVLGNVPLFQANQHARLDAYLHLPPNHHNGSGGGISDDVAFDPNVFAPYKNTVTLSKLLLLDGPTLNQVMSDLTGHPYSLYTGAKTENIMTTVLPGVAGAPNDQWLTLIDGDHAWRANGLPVFNRKSGGEGNFPLWESCILREDGFRGLFTDWENGSANFPDLGDPISGDPNDPAAPTSSLVIGNPKHVDGTTTYVSGGTPLTVSATDGFWSASELVLTVRLRAGSAVGGAFTPISNPGNVSLAGQPDGVVHIDLQASDPCGVETVHTIDVVLDSTPPVVTYTQPANAQYDTDDFASIAYTVADALSGVASDSVTLDGIAATNGQVLDMFFLNAGLHTITVTATDNVGNTGTTNRVFRVRATSASLLNNLDRAHSLGLIPDLQVYRGLRDSLVAANQSHNKNKHPTEWNQLVAFINQLLGQRGNGIDLATANRFIGFAQDLIASGG